MKIFLLLEPPFSTISLELEDAAVAKKYFYFSLSDVFMSETGGDSDVAKRLKEAKAEGKEMLPHFAYRLILEKYLQKAPKNYPNGIVLDPDCFSSAEELQILLEVLEKFGNKIDSVFDIQVSEEECADYIEDYGVEEEEGLMELKDYFENLYPETLRILNDKGIVIEVISADEDPRELIKRFNEYLS